MGPPPFLRARAHRPSLLPNLSLHKGHEGDAAWPHQVCPYQPVQICPMGEGGTCVLERLRGGRLVLALLQAADSVRLRVDVLGYLG